MFTMEDTLKNLNSRDRTFKHTFDTPRNFWNRYLFTSKIGEIYFLKNLINIFTFAFFIEWYWKCVFSSYVRKLLAIMAGILSVAVVWSEVTFFNKQPVLSIFANIVNVAKVKYDYFTIEV